MKGATLRARKSPVSIAAFARSFLFWESDSAPERGLDSDFVPTWLRAPLGSGLAAHEDLIRKWLGYLFPPNEPAPAQQLRTGHPEVPAQKGIPTKCFHGLLPPDLRHGRLPVSPSVQAAPHPRNLTLGPMENPDSPDSHWPPRKLQNRGVGWDPLGSRETDARPSVLFTVMKPSPSPKAF